MVFLDLPPALGATGSVRLPGSKSISNRSLLLAALAEGQTEIRDLLASDDVDRMLEALSALGIVWERDEANGSCRVNGAGGCFPMLAADLFLGNAGTAFRPLTAVLALCGGTYRLSGVARMHERPVGDLVDALAQLGATIEYDGESGYPPLTIRPGDLHATPLVTVRGDVSSQFLTALLMALPLHGGGATIEVVGDLISKPYVLITLELMARFGVHVRREGWQRFVIPADACYRSPGVLFVEGDASSASYFLAAGAIGGGPVRVEGVGRDSIQGDVRFVEALAQLGARVEVGDNWIEARGPEGGGRLKAFDLDLNHIPDAAMTLAVAALFADGPCTLRNIASWRVKETDRLAAMATELRKVGAEVEEGADCLRVVPPRALVAAAIDTYDDHRIAMCFSLVTLGACRVRINDPKCVNKTFPSYFDEFAAIVRPVPVIAIDGPSASGKGTVAARVAAALGYHYLDSGALYRVVALAALLRGIALDDEEGLTAVAATLPVRFEGATILLDEQEVTDAIRTEQCSSGASKVAVLPAVRAALLDRQRDFRRAPGLVAEGRDMGSVVFPDAECKFFLTATVDARAQRRYQQLMGKGQPATLESLSKELEARDARDAARTVAPLKKLADAVLLDTTMLDVGEAVSFVLDTVCANTVASAR